MASTGGGSPESSQPRPAFGRPSVPPWQTLVSRGPIPVLPVFLPSKTLPEPFLCVVGRSTGRPVNARSVLTPRCDSLDLSPAPASEGSSPCSSSARGLFRCADPSMSPAGHPSSLRALPSLCNRTAGRHLYLSMNLFLMNDSVFNAARARERPPIPRRLRFFRFLISLAFFQQEECFDPPVDVPLDPI